MKPLSTDLRQRIVDVYEEGELSYAQVANRFRVSESSVKRVVQRWRETGSVTPKPAAGGNPPKLAEAGMAQLKIQVEAQLDASQDELRAELANKIGVEVSQSTISRTLKRAGITRKKKTKRAAEQNRPDVKAARQQFEDERPTLNAEDIISVDEMGAVTGLSRTYGYALRGERAVSYESGRKGTRLSLIGALSVNGFLGGLEVKGTVTGDVFEAFVEHVLVPQLKPGQLVLVDNASFHARDSIQELIEAQGARVKFLPAYSPEYNPIEECWSKIKAWLRKRTARTVKALQEAITEAIQRVTAKDAKGWFRHAGYQVQ